VGELVQGGPGLTYQSLCVEAQDGNETKSWFYVLHLSRGVLSFPLQK